jgi:riboflavin kinase/FMN adenylyltransferase
MRIFKHYNQLPERYRNGSIAIGNFDGLHKGHSAVIARAGSFASERGLPWGVLTFEPHPRTLFKKNDPPFRLTPFGTKARQIESMGVEFLVVINFDKEFAKITADEFVEKVLVHGFEASYVVSGFNFAFGRNRTGNTRFLQTKGKQFGFGTSGVKQVLDETREIISSTRIRNLLIDGNTRKANKLIGRHYEIEGCITHGDKRGRTIGFPTANVELGDNIKPATGVYAIQATTSEGSDTIWHDGIANLGYRPTFSGDKCILETHLFDFDKNIYDKNLRVGLIEFLRPEQKFDGIDELQSQIKKDCSHAKFILASE